jgi:hypothetical protein
MTEKFLDYHRNPKKIIVTIIENKPSKTNSKPKHISDIGIE